MNLSGKTRAEIAAALASKSRAELVELIVSLVAFDRLLTAREISEASHVSKRDVLADMRDGRFVDPLFGPGFFCRATNSLRVSASAANAWRQSFFVPVTDRVLPGDAIPGHKKGGPFPSLLQSAEDHRRRTAQAKLGCNQDQVTAHTDLNGENAPAKGRRIVRQLSPGYLCGQRFE